jgi:hypothetical protein
VIGERWKKRAPLDHTGHIDCEALAFTNCPKAASFHDVRPLWFYISVTPLDG